MPRILACSLGATFLALAAAFQPSGIAQDAPAGANLELELPESSEPPDYAPERVSHLTIDGKDLSTPRRTRRLFEIKPAKGDSVTVVYTFWPNTYTKIVRTKVVKLEKGKLVKASLEKADKQTPDKIFPIYVPTPQGVVNEMCKMAKVTKEDVVYDIGCGDGRLVITAVRDFGAKKGVGIDIDKDLVKKCVGNAKKAKVDDRASFQQKDALTIKDFSEASVVFLYLGQFLNEALEPTLKKTLKPGARVVSHRFLMSKDWPPEKTVLIKDKNNSGEDDEFKLHLWTIKAPKKTDS